MPNRILVVDDEPDYRLIIEEALKPTKAEVVCAANGQEALSLLEKEEFKPDVILLDWSMPKLDGEGFCRALRAREQFKGIPIIMLTVKEGVDAELEAFHFGVDDFLTKPFKPLEILAHVHSVLRRAAPAN